MQKQMTPLMIFLLEFYLMIKAATSLAEIVILIQLKIPTLEVM